MSSSAAAIRNIAFVGHPSAGKTTLVDALAFDLGCSERKGSVADKTSICDTEPEEQEKQHTLQMKAVHAEKDGHVWNLFDTPGYPDFTADAIAGMFATDLVIGVVSCSSGASFNLRKKLERAAQLGRGRMLVVTHVDGENASFDDVVADLRVRVGEVCVPINVPDRSGPGFAGVRPVLGGDAELAEWRSALMDRVMDACDDEQVVGAYLETEVLSPEQLVANLPIAIATGALVPILTCNPASGVGLAELVTFLRTYAPSADVSALYTSGGAPFPAGAGMLGVVVGVRSDPHVGRVCIGRVLRGQLGTAEPLVPVGNDGRGEKIGGLFHLVGGKRRDPVDSGRVGDIVAFTKVEKIGLFDTFTTAGGTGPAVDRPDQPGPSVAMAVQPKSRADEQKIGEALHKLATEDPTFQVKHDHVTRELVILGASDLHLQVMESRLKRRFGVEIETHLPKIAYKETVSKPADAHYRHKKQTGGRGQFGECYLRVRPGEQNAGLVFIDKVVGGSIPRNLIPAVEKGVREVAAMGVLTESQVVDVEVELYDGKFHAVDSDEASFKMAGSRAFRAGFLNAGPVLLEPVMEVEIHVPAHDAGVVFSDITSQRRGHVVDQSSDGTDTVIKAHVPLATMQTYFRDLKSQTAGQGSFTMVLARYAMVPMGEQQRVLAVIGRKHEEE